MLVTTTDISEKSNVAYAKFPQLRFALQCCLVLRITLALANKSVMLMQLDTKGYLPTLVYTTKTIKVY